MASKNGKDLVGSEGWDDVWKGRAIPDPVDPACTTLEAHRDHQFHLLFTRIFAGMSGKALLEAGCAKSRWLPYFALSHGFRVEGLDYSETGCEQSRAILAKAGVDGKVHRKNMFDCPELAGRFDAVVSFGLVEHFTDTAEALAALGALLRPGGLLVSIVPNVRGLPGLFLRMINRKSYDQHMALPPQVLSEAVRRAGLEAVETRYLLTLNLSVLSLALVQRGDLWWVKPVWNTFDLATAIASRLIRAGMPEMPNRVTSPYIVSVARKGWCPPRRDAPADDRRGIATEMIED